MIKSLSIPLMFLLLAFAPSKLIKTKLTQGVQVSLPAELKAMTPQDIAQRFPSVRAPLGAFSTDDRLTDFSVNISATQWPDNNLDMAAKFFKAGIYNMYDRVDIISEGTYEVHKKKFIYFEFESSMKGGKVRDGFQPAVNHYTFIQYLIEPKRSLVFSLTSPKDQREQWQETAHEVMKSIVVK